MCPLEFFGSHNGETALIFNRAAHFVHRFLLLPRYFMISPWGKQTLSIRQTFQWVEHGPRVNKGLYLFTGNANRPPPTAGPPSGVFLSSVQHTRTHRHTSTFAIDCSCTICYLSSQWMPVACFFSLWLIWLAAVPCLISVRHRSGAVRWTCFCITNI